MSEQEVGVKEPARQYPLGIPFCSDLQQLLLSQKLRLLMHEKEGALKMGGMKMELRLGAKR